MSRKLITNILAILAIVAFIAVPTAVVGQDDLHDMQLFGYADYSDFGRGAQPAEGYFFNFQGLMWSVSTPTVTDIGNPNVQRVVYYSETATATQGNTFDTSFIGATVSTGQRYELGYVHNGRGLLFSAYHLNSQTNTDRTSAFSMTFDDEVWGKSGLQHLVGYYIMPPAGTPRDLPIDFGSSVLRNRVRTWGVELMGLCRTHQLHKGGFFEFFAGARYLEFNDEFSVNAYGWWLEPIDGEGDDDEDEEDLERAGILADSWWKQDAKNHIVGPQFGFRWMKRNGRWWFNAEGRFFAGFNSMSAHQRGLLGSELDPSLQKIGYPTAMGPSSFSSDSHQNEWSPCIELRAGLDFQWTKNVKLGVGWTGIWIDNVARASNMIDYTLGESSYMGILENTQDVFMTGVNFSIDINR